MGARGEGDIGKGSLSSQENGAFYSALTLVSGATVETEVPHAGSDRIKCTVVTCLMQQNVTKQGLEETAHRLTHAWAGEVRKK